MREELDAAASSNASATDAYNDMPNARLVAPVAAVEAAEQASEADADAATETNTARDASEPTPPA